jgi:hypothetical protein
VSGGEERATDPRVEHLARYLGARASVADRREALADEREGVADEREALPTSANGSQMNVSMPQTSAS